MGVTSRVLLPAAARRRFCGHGSAVAAESRNARRRHRPPLPVTSGKVSKQMADLAAEYGFYAPQRAIAGQGVGNEIRPCPLGLSVASFGGCFSSWQTADHTIFLNVRTSAVQRDATPGPVLPLQHLPDQLEHSVGHVAELQVDGGGGYKHRALVAE